MAVTPKSLEVRQAQLAAFTAECIVYSDDRDHIYKNFGRLAVGELCDVTTTTDWREWRLDTEDDSLSVSPDMVRTVTTAEQYIDFLRTSGNPKSDVVRERTELLRTFRDTFAVRVDSLLEEIAELPDGQDHPALLGQGTISKVYRMVFEGREYAVRVPYVRSIPVAEVDDHIAGALLVKGAPHFEQIVAASYEKGVTVSELLPGKRVGFLSTNEIKAITDAQFEQLVETVATAYRRGVSIDTGSGNILYDPEEGFGIIDYSVKNHESYDSGHSLKTVIRDVVDMALVSFRPHYPLLKRRLEDMLPQAVKHGEVRNHPFN